MDLKFWVLLSMLVAKDLKFTYSNGPSFSFPDFSCGKEEQLLLLGESGKGKTTLLHLLAGMLKASSGTLELMETDLRNLSAGELDRFRGEHIGIVFQTAHFVESLNVEDNLIMPQYLCSKKIDRQKAKTILSRLNLEHKLKEFPKNLSVGEQQRVAIARALMNDPQVILADEPTSALDDKNAMEVIQLLEEQAKATGAALVIVTHDQRLKDHVQKHIQL